MSTHATPPTTPADTWEAYASCWHETDKARRRARFEASLDPQCHYRDPLASADGHDALAAYMDEFQRQIPGGRFVTQQYWHHHEQSVAVWQMQSGTGEVLGNGVSYARYNAGGKLVSMTGFFDPPPAG